MLSHPYLILLDINLLEVDGYEICRQLGRSPSLEQVPIVILTAKDDPVHRIRARGVGAVDYITKPVTPQELLKPIQKFLNVVISPVGDASAASPRLNLHDNTLLWSVAHLRLALSKEQQHTLNTAIPKLQAAIAQAPQNSKPYTKLVVALYLTKPTGGCPGNANSVNSFSTNRTEPLPQLSLARGTTGGHSIAHYEYVLRLDPTDQRCRGRLEFLRQQHQGAQGY